MLGFWLIATFIVQRTFELPGRIRIRRGAGQRFIDSAQINPTVAPICV